MEQKIILLADDDRDDTEIFCEALEGIDSNIICHNYINGEELLNNLHLLNKSPILIFLDVNMPIMNGWDCLKILKEDKRYKDIPVIIMSTSSHKKEMDIAMTLGALCYFVKPNTFDELMEALKVITANLGKGLIKTVQDIQFYGSKYIFAFTENPD